MLEISIGIILTLLALLSWAGSLLGMPGNWVIVLMAAGSLLMLDPGAASYVGWVPLIGIVLVAGLGELLEFIAGALGASRLGGSKRGTAMSLVGSIAGAVAGLFMGSVIPIPIVGSLIGSLTLGAAGAFGGAMVGERWAGKDWDTSIQIGSAAFWGRLLGTVAKAVCGTVACGIFLAAIWF